MIEKILPGNKTKLKILENIYLSASAGINLTGLINKVHASPNLVLSYINLLLEHEIIKEERLGGKKKTHIRIIKPSFENETANDIYTLVELHRTSLFFEKYKSLKPIFLQLTELLKRYNGFALLYGSFARLAAENDSDIDIVIVSNLQREDIAKIREIFITQNNELSLKVETLNKFISNNDKPLYQNILREHIVIYGAHEFIKILSEFW